MNAKRHTRRQSSEPMTGGRRAYGSLSLHLLVMAVLLTVTFAPQPLLAGPLPPVTEADGRLGTCYAFYTGPQGDRTPQAYNAGSRWDRFDFRWSAMSGDVQGALNFAPHEEIVTRDLNNGLSIVGILGSTALWAADCSGVTSVEAQQSPARLSGQPTAGILWDATWQHACPPQNLYSDWDSANNYWAAYVHEVVGHFKGQVDVWEIWNEQDSEDTDGTHYYWKGTAQEYAQLLKVSYLAAKDANPDAVILFGGLAYWGRPTFYTDVLDTLAADPDSAAHNGYFDVMSLHLYTNVYHMHDVSKQVMQAVTSRVGSHPLWLTETGVRIWDEDTRPPDTPIWPPYYTATAEEASWQMIQAYANARAAGVEKFFYFRLHDDYSNIKQIYGLTRDDYTLRPAYTAYQIAARYLRGENQITGPFAFGTTGRRVTFWGTPYGKIDVLWNSSPTTTAYTYPAILPTATVLNHRGETQTVTAVNGAFNLTLSGATSNNHPEGEYIIGGPPVLLIQADTVPPISGLRPFPQVTASSTFTLSWDVEDVGSGYWYEEVERAAGPTGPWTRIAGLSQTQGVTQTQVSILSNGTWYFRSRARDRAGNWEAWPLSAELSTTVASTQTVTLSVTAFSDLNGNDSKETEEPWVEDATLLWKGPTGTPLLDAVGGPWEITQEVLTGPHSLYLSHSDHLPQSLTFQVESGAVPQVVTYTVGLRLIRARVYLPTVLRSSSGAVN